MLTETAIVSAVLGLIREWLWLQYWSVVCPAWSRRIDRDVCLSCPLRCRLHCQSLLTTSDLWLPLLLSVLAATVLTVEAVWPEGIRAASHSRQKAVFDAVDSRWKCNINCGVVCSFISCLMFVMCLTEVEFLQNDEQCAVLLLRTSKEREC